MIAKTTPMPDMSAEYRQILKQEFDSRRIKNARYSLRGYAKLLNCDPTFLSKLMSGKLILSVDRANEFSQKLKLSQELRKTLILSAAEEQRCRAVNLVAPELTDCNGDDDSGCCG